MIQRKGGTEQGQMREYDLTSHNSAQAFPPPGGGQSVHVLSRCVQV